MAPIERRPRRVQIWQGGDPEWAICIRAPTTPPSPLSFEDNLDETLRFFEHVRQSSQIARDKYKGFVIRSDKPNGLPKILSYADFSRISDISTAAAVVLSAEYERLAVLDGEVPPTVELDKWNDSVFRKLYQLGFFEIVGLTPDRDDVIIESGDTRTMRIVSTKNGDDLARVDAALQQLGSFLNPHKNIPEQVIIDILTALSEAISNVTNHAYPDNIDIGHKHIGSLWVAATADRSQNSLTIVVYDQGATIPITYPRIGRLAKVARYLERTLKKVHQFEYDDDGTYIRAAIRHGGSRTDQSHRGKGLPQMIEMLSRSVSGSMTVYSRGGWCRRTSNGRFRSGAVPYSIGGTLIEWSVQLS